MGEQSNHFEICSESCVLLNNACTQRELFHESLKIRVSAEPATEGEREDEEKGNTQFQPSLAFDKREGRYPTLAISSLLVSRKVGLGEGS